MGFQEQTMRALEHPAVFSHHNRNLMCRRVGFFRSSPSKTMTQFVWRVGGVGWGGWRVSRMSLDHGRAYKLKSNENHNSKSFSSQCIFVEFRARQLERKGRQGRGNNKKVFTSCGLTRGEGGGPGSRGSYQNWLFAAPGQRSYLLTECQPPEIWLRHTHSGPPEYWSIS